MKPNLPLLQGIRVIEVASMLMAPSAAAVLSDFGAEIIKVEPPKEGDPNRHLHQMPGMPESEIPFCFVQDNRNKRSIALDLKTEAGQEILQKLVKTADVFVTNYRPSALKKLNLTYEASQALNPRLIYAYGSAFGDKGPEADKGGYDMIGYWARSGIESAMLPPHGEMSRFPTGTGDHPSGMSLFGSIMLALFARERTGQGYKVSTSLLANGAWTNSSFIQAKLCGAQFRESRPRENAYNFSTLSYQSKDDKLIKLTIVNTERDWPRLCQALKRPDLAKETKFKTDEARRENMKELIMILDHIFAEQDLEKWIQLLLQYDIPHSRVADYDDVIRDEQMIANDFFAEMEHPRFGHLQTVSSPIAIEDVEKSQPQPPPELGQHSQQILEELGYNPAQIELFLKQGVI